MLILKWTFCAWNLAEENQGRTLQTNALQQQSWGQYLWHLINILPRQDWSACINPERNHAYWGPCWCTLLLLMLLSIHLMLKFQEWSWGCLRWTQLCMPINLISTWVNWCGCCRKSSNGNHHQILSGCQLIAKKKKDSYWLPAHKLRKRVSSFSTIITLWLKDENLKWLFGWHVLYTYCGLITSNIIFLCWLSEI